MMFRLYYPNFQEWLYAQKDTKVKVDLVYNNVVKHGYIVEAIEMRSDYLLGFCEIQKDKTLSDTTTFYKLSEVQIRYKPSYTNVDSR